MFLKNIYLHVGAHLVNCIIKNRYFKNLIRFFYFFSKIYTFSKITESKRQFYNLQKFFHHHWEFVHILPVLPKIRLDATPKQICIEDKPRKISDL